MANKKMGRPKMGNTRKISLTLPDDVWGAFDSLVERQGYKYSEILRLIVVEHVNMAKQNVSRETLDKKNLH